MKALALFGTTGGLMLLVLMMWSFPKGALLSTLAVAGWPLAAAIAVRSVPLLLNAVSWRSLLPPVARPPLYRLIWLRWIGESLNGLLPLAQVGGDLARARLLTLAGVAGAGAVASMIADITIGAGTQAVVTLAGVALMPLRGTVGQMTTAILIGVLLLAASAASLMGMIQVGVRRIVGAVPAMLRRAEGWSRLTDRAGGIDHALDALLRRRGDIFASAVWHLAGWITQAAETWLVLRLLGRPVDFLTAFIIDSLTGAARGAVFFVPAGVGIQEGALVGIATRVGVDPSTALGLAVIRRLRELTLAIPGMVVWLIAERRLIGGVLRGRPRSLDRSQGGASQSS